MPAGAVDKIESLVTNGAQPDEFSTEECDDSLSHHIPPFHVRMFAPAAGDHDRDRSQGD